VLPIGFFLWGFQTKCIWCTPRSVNHILSVISFNLNSLIILGKEYSFWSSSPRYVVIRAVPWLRRLAASLSQRRARFVPGSVHVGIVVHKMALGQVFSSNSVFPCQYNSAKFLHAHISFWRWARWWPQFRDIVSPYRHELILSQSLFLCARCSLAPSTYVPSTNWETKFHTYRENDRYSDLYACWEVRGIQETWLVLLIFRRCIAGNMNSISSSFTSTTTKNDTT
jgi:hypothetical protein